MIARQIALGETAAATATQNRAIESVLMLTLPAAVGLSVAAVPVMDVLFVRGAFTTHTASSRRARWLHSPSACRSSLW